MNKLLESLVCSGSECSCWILVLFNIFAVFYLVFCSFWKISRLSKVYGWVYSGILICTAILILFFHTCIYTLLATIFTGMMLMAILSIVMPQQGERSTRNEGDPSKKAVGAYVISETLDGWFVFSIYDSKRKHLINSTYAYDSIEKVKEEINNCRESGVIAETEDRSGRWIQERYIPKFVLTKNGERYEFYLRVIDKESIIRSKEFKKLSCCMEHLEKVKLNVGSTDVYMSVDKVSSAGYQKWGQIVEMPLAEEPVNDEPAVEKTVIEDAPSDKKRIVGILWPESDNPDKIYSYQAGNEAVEIGDIVVVPTFDSFSQKEVVRKAQVVRVEYYQDGDGNEMPTKSVISVEKVPSNLL